VDKNEYWLRQGKSPFSERGYWLTATRPKVKDLDLCAGHLARDGFAQPGRGEILRRDLFPIATQKCRGQESRFLIQTAKFLSEKVPKLVRSASLIVVPLFEGQDALGIEGAPGYHTSEMDLQPGGMHGGIKM